MHVALISSSPTHLPPTQRVHQCQGAYRIQPQSSPACPGYHCPYRTPLIPNLPLCAWQEVAEQLGSYPQPTPLALSCSFSSISLLCSWNSLINSEIPAPINSQFILQIFPVLGFSAASASLKFPFICPKIIISTLAVFLLCSSCQIPSEEEKIMKE